MDSLQCTLVIPAAGQSTRFYPLNKTLIKFWWGGRYRTMLEHCIPSGWPGPIRVAVRRDMLHRLPTMVYDGNLEREVIIVAIDDTRGQAHTVAQSVLGIEGDILVINSDNAFDAHMGDFVTACREKEAVAGAVVINSSEPRFGYVDNWPYFNLGVEKKPISMFALAGAFYFANRELIADAYSKMPLKEPYVSGMFQHMPGLKLAHLIPFNALHEWGTPEAFERDTGEKLKYEER